MQYIDLSFVIGAIAVLLIVLLTRKVWPVIEALLPPSLLLFVKWFAETVVNAIEVKYGGGEGELKRREAFKRIMKMIKPLVGYLETRGFTLDAERVYEAIEAAWNKMNTDQIKAGVKPADPQEAIE